MQGLLEAFFLLLRLFIHQIVWAEKVLAEPCFPIEVLPSRTKMVIALSHSRCCLEHVLLTIKQVFLLIQVSRVEAWRGFFSRISK